MSGVNSDVSPWNNWDLQRIAEELHVPSDFPGRTRIQVSGIVNPAVAGSLYNVTAGKRLFVKTLQVNFFTSAAVANSYATVRDGNTADIKSITAFTSSAGSALAVNLGVLMEPLIFNTSVWASLDVGTYSRISYTIIGWEENV